MDTVQGYRIPFVQEPPPTCLPQFALSQEQNQAITQEIESLLKKGAIQDTRSPEEVGFVSNVFLVPKSEGKWRLILNLKALNQFVIYEHFKMEDIRCVKDLLNRGDYMCKLDLKDAYLLTPIHRSFRKFLKFTWHGRTYEYTALPFGLSAAPRVFTKLLKPILGSLREKGIRLIAYLDDFLLIGKTKNQAEESFQKTKTLMESLGFVINEDKSQSEATQKIEFLGFLIDSMDMMFRLTATRVKQIKEKCKQALESNQMTLRELAHMVGVLVATQLAGLPAPLHYRSLQAQKNEGILLHSYDTKVTLNPQSQKTFTGGG